MWQVLGDRLLTEARGGRRETQWRMGGDGVFVESWDKGLSEAVRAKTPGDRIIWGLYLSLFCCCAKTPKTRQLMEVLRVHKDGESLAARGLNRKQKDYIFNSK